MEVDRRMTEKFNNVLNDEKKWEIIQGDCLKALACFPSGAFDAIITDPPYASGGRTQAEKQKSTVKKSHSFFQIHLLRSLISREESAFKKPILLHSCTLPLYTIL